MESQRHWDGKVRLEKILLESGWTIWLHDGDDSFQFETSRGPRNFWPDLLAWHDGDGWVAFEVDGIKGHSTRTDLIKMEVRDKAFEAVDVRTVRIQTRDLVGRYKQTDDLVKLEINWQLS